MRGQLFERDGVHLLDLEGEDEVAGSLIDFHPGKGGDAYNAIDALEPDRVYRWDTCDAVTSSGMRRARTLLGRSVRRGSHTPDGPYRSRDDPLFLEGIAEVEAVLSSYERRSSDEVGDYFRLQMAYMLLWTAIERYCTLRFGFTDRVVERVERLANEPEFAKALAKHVTETRKVYRADRPADQAETLDPANPLDSVRFYYQVRSNIAHRGKTIYDEQQLVKRSLQELTAIFNDVLDATLGQPRAR